MTQRAETTRYFVGIDAGSVSLNALVMNEGKAIVYELPYKRHFGKVEEETLSLIQHLYEKFGQESIRSIAFTGNHGKNLSDKLGLFYEFETISQVLGVLFLRPDTKTIVSMGGQDTALFQIKHRDGAWELDYFATNGPCASGTGSFIDQQAERLATALYENNRETSQIEIDRVLSDFIALGLKSTKPAHVAPSAKALSLVPVLSMPMAWHATSSSRRAISVNSGEPSSSPWHSFGNFCISALAGCASRSSAWNFTFT